MVKNTTVVKRRRQPRKATLEIVSTNLRVGRAQLKLSQDSLAAKAGVHRSYVGDLERCEQNPTLSTLEALADALEISISALLEDPKPKPGRKRR